jgi:hypothetical protein
LVRPWGERRSDELLGAGAGARQPGARIVLALRPCLIWAPGVAFGCERRGAAERGCGTLCRPGERFRSYLFSAQQVCRARFGVWVRWDNERKSCCSMLTNVFHAGHV